MQDEHDQIARLGVTSSILILAGLTNPGLGAALALGVAGNLITPMAADWLPARITRLWRKHPQHASLQLLRDGYQQAVRMLRDKWQRSEAGLEMARDWHHSGMRRADDVFARLTELGKELFQSAPEGMVADTSVTQQQLDQLAANWHATVLPLVGLHEPYQDQHDPVLASFLHEHLEPVLRQAMRELLLGSDPRATRVRNSLILTSLERLLAYAGQNSRVASPPQAAKQPVGFPTPMTKLVGRTNEVRRAAELLGKPVRLLTLTGTGGVGKTRVALEAARTVQEEHQLEVAYADLTSLSRQEDLAPALISAIGATEAAPVAEFGTLIASLGQRRLLLVLDNCEHLAAACAELAAQILAACPELRILATSRSPLSIPGETVEHVEPLASPDPAHMPSLEHLATYPSIQLFLERARERDNTLSITTQNAEAMARICYTLDGLPLGLEIAAARIGAFSPGIIADQLERGALALTGTRGVAERHRSLQTVLQWSYELLAPAEQQLVARLAAFRGGWSLVAARAVCSDVALPERDVEEALGQLVQQSLVVRQDVGGEARYGFLATVRRYALDRLEASGQYAAWHARHLSYYSELADEAEEGLQGPEQCQWLDLLEKEVANLQEALDFGAATPSFQAHALVMTTDLLRFWIHRGHAHDGSTWLDKLLPGSTNLPAESLANAYLAKGSLSWATDDYPAAIAAFQQAVTLAQQSGDEETRVLAQAGLDSLALIDGYDPQAARRLEESVAVFEAQGDRRNALVAQAQLGILARCQGDYPEARRRFTQALERYEVIGDYIHQAMLHGQLAEIAYQTGQYDEATQHIDTAQQLYEQAGERSGSAQVLTQKAMLAKTRGNPSDAIPLYEEALATYEELEDAPGIALTKANFGEALISCGDLDRAQRVLEESQAYYETHKDATGLARAHAPLGLLALIQGDLDLAGRLLALLWRDRWRGCIHQREQHPYQGTSAHPAPLVKTEHAKVVLEYSLNAARQRGDRAREVGLLGTLAVVSLQLGQMPQAASRLLETLRLSRELGDADGYAKSLSMFARLAVLLNETAVAAQFLGAADSQFRKLGTTPSEIRPEGVPSLQEVIEAQLGSADTAALGATGSGLNPDLLLDMAQTLVQKTDPPSTTQQ